MASKDVPAVRNSVLSIIAYRCRPRAKITVIGLLVFAVFDELPRQNVRFELDPGDEMIILAVDLAIFFRPTSIYDETQTYVTFG